MRRARADADQVGAEQGDSGRESRNGSGTITRIAGDAGAAADSRPVHGAERRQPPPRSPAGRQQQREAHMEQDAGAGDAKETANGAAVRSSIRTPARRRRIGAGTFTAAYFTRAPTGCPGGAGRHPRSLDRRR
jgi:hypothetical protein